MSKPITQDTTLHIKIDGTEQEFTALTQLIDVAVKGAGLQAAEAGLFWARKIGAAVAASKTPAPEVSNENAE